MSHRKVSFDPFSDETQETHVVALKPSAVLSVAPRLRLAEDQRRCGGRARHRGSSGERAGGVAGEQKARKSRLNRGWAGSKSW